MDLTTVTLLAVILLGVLLTSLTGTVIWRLSSLERLLDAHLLAHSAPPVVSYATLNGRVR